MKSSQVPNSTGHFPVMIMEDRDESEWHKIMLQFLRMINSMEADATCAKIQHNDELNHLT